MAPGEATGRGRSGPAGASGAARGRLDGGVWLSAGSVRLGSSSEHREALAGGQNEVLQWLWEPAGQGWLGCGGKVGLPNVF